MAYVLLISDYLSDEKVYHELASQLSLSDDEYSQPIAIGGDNTAFAEIVVYNTSGSPGLDLYIQGSNDLQNWTSGTQVLSLAGGSVTAGYHKATSLATVTTAYIRLRYDMTVGSTTIVLAAGINTSYQ